MKNNIICLIIALFAFTSSFAFAGTCDNNCTTPVMHEQKDGPHKPQRFDPEKYQRDLEAYITKHAHLTEQEAQNFFPLFREMQQKLRTIYMNNKKYNRAAFTDNKVALEAISNHDSQEIKIKKLQQEYHNRFLKVLPATKVLMCIYAEEAFNKIMMRNIGRHK